MLTHDKLRQLAKTLHHFNVLEILVIVFFSWLCFDLLYFIMGQVDSGNEANVLGILATGVTVPIAGLVFGMLKSVGDTYKANKND